MLSFRNESMPTVGDQAVAAWRAVGIVASSLIHLERGDWEVAVGQGTELTPQRWS